MIGAFTINSHLKKIPNLFSTLFLKSFTYSHNTPHTNKIPSHDPNQPKKGVKKHHKTFLKNKVNASEESPLAEDNMILQIPVRRVDPYVMDIPKVDRHKEEKNIKHKPDFVSVENNLNPKDLESDVEIPETRMPEVLTPNTPTTKVRVRGSVNKNIRGGIKIPSEK
jgi:hypothetical protein